MKPLYKYARFVSPKYRARRSTGGTIVSMLASVGAIFAAIKIFPSARRYLRIKRM